MQKIRIQTTQNVTIEYELASLGDRILATFIDMLIIAATYLVFFLLVQQSTNSQYLYYVFLLIGIIAWLYHLLCEIFMNGQTVGKKARGIKVIRRDGRQATVGNYTLRWIIRPLDITFSLGSIALLFIITTAKGQRLGDIAAGTTVIKIKHRTNLQERELPSLDEKYTPTFQEVTRLHDGDIEIIREVIQTFHTNSRREPVDLLAQKLKEMLGIKSNLESYAFLTILLNDYIYFTRGVF